MVLGRCAYQKEKIAAKLPVEVNLILAQSARAKTARIIYLDVHVLGPIDCIYSDGHMSIEQSGVVVVLYHLAVGGTHHFMISLPTIQHWLYPPQLPPEIRAQKAASMSSSTGMQPPKRHRQCLAPTIVIIIISDNNSYHHHWFYIWMTTSEMKRIYSWWKCKCMMSFKNKDGMEYTVGTYVSTMNALWRTLILPKTSETRLSPPWDINGAQQTHFLHARACC